MPTTPLLSAAELLPHLEQSDWLVVDCRFDLARPAAGEDAYELGHIPGAVYAHLDRDLSSAITPTSGRHPLPSPAQFAATLSRWGVTSETQVVAYDADTGAYAARLWWMLRWVGHWKVAVLDGGFKAWQAAGLPVTPDARAFKLLRPPGSRCMVGCNAGRGTRAAKRLALARCTRARTLRRRSRTHRRCGGTCTGCAQSSVRHQPGT